VVSGNDESHFNRNVRDPVNFLGDQSPDLKDLVSTYRPDMDGGPARERKDVKIDSVLGQCGYGADILHLMKAVELGRWAVLCLSCVVGCDQISLRRPILPV
jgi:hypothetical protein